MEPITLLLVAVQHSVIAPVRHKARQGEKDYHASDLAVIQGVSTKVGAEAAIESLKKLSPKAATIPVGELVGIGETVYEILQDVSKHQEARARVNESLIRLLEKRGLGDQVAWECPRSHTGYDRGHMAPNYGIDICYGKEAQVETFLLNGAGELVQLDNMVFA